VGTSDEGIPNTSFSKQGHRYGAVYQLSHDGPELTASAGRFEVKGRQVIGRVDGERLSATTLPLTGITGNKSVMCNATARASRGLV
jgi:hypothetical protein